MIDTTTPSAIDTLAGAFWLARRGAAKLWLRRDVAAELREADLWSLERFFEEDSPFEGRGGTAAAELKGGRRIVVCPYRHGGLLRALTGECFKSSRRLESELAVSWHLEQAGLHVPRALGGRALHLGPWRWKLHLITERIPDARDFKGVLEELPPRRGKGLGEWRAAVREAGEQVRAVHDADVDHTDLHVKNLLLGPGGRAWVIDLDNARRGANGARRTAALAKLYRSGQKLRAGQRPTRTECARFARAYYGESWKQGWNEVRRHYDRGLILHRLGWRLERLYRR
ncbi:MAG: lipopolysaccharide kinase InaA family protein [Planctomycetota bacterium]